MKHENLVKYSQDFPLTRVRHDGVQKIYVFENGYGASVVQHKGSYGGDQGLWELAVITFPTENREEFKLNYTTPITEDVVGFLKWKEALKIMEDIKKLPPFQPTEVFIA